MKVADFLWPTTCMDEGTLSRSAVQIVIILHTSGRSYRLLCRCRLYTALPAAGRYLFTLSFPLPVPRQHRVARRASRAVCVPIWTRPHAGEFISVSEWNSPQVGQMLLRRGASNHRGWSSSVKFKKRHCGIFFIVLV